MLADFCADGCLLCKRISAVLEKIEGTCGDRRRCDWSRMVSVAKELAGLGISFRATCDGRYLATT